VAVIRLFASAREAAGTGSDSIDGAVLGTCRIWLNGSAADRADAVTPADEVAVLPPVSGGFQ
jgi:molybdopterin converting factor small subunit